MKNKQLETSLTKNQRLKLNIGALILIIGFLSPLLIPFVVASDLSAAFKSVVSGLLAFGIPEVFMLIAVGIMGKSGYQYLKNKTLKFITIVSPDRVSPLRHRIGVVLFCVPIILGLLQPYLANYIPFLNQLPLSATIGMDLMLLLSLFVLGGGFWDKIRGLFVYDEVSQ